jgi:hypothetical protein
MIDHVERPTLDRRTNIASFRSHRNSFNYLQVRLSKGKGDSPRQRRNSRLT